MIDVCRDNSYSPYSSLSYRAKKRYITDSSTSQGDLIANVTKRELIVQLLGSYQVGKSTFFDKICQDYSPDPPSPRGAHTARVDSVKMPSIVTSDGEEWNVYLRDTNGQEKFSSLMQTSLKSAIIFVTIYRQDRYDSFQQISEIWLEHIKSQSQLPDNCTPSILLLGNQFPPSDSRFVTQGEGDNFFQNYNDDFSFFRKAHKLMNPTIGVGIEECVNWINTTLEEVVADKTRGKTLCLTGSISLVDYMPGDVYPGKERRRENCCNRN